MDNPLDFVFHPSVKPTIRFKARQLCNRSDHNWSDFEDIEQSMTMHLIEKSHRFDDQRGCANTFASAVLDLWIKQYLRDMNRLKRGGRHRATPFSQIGRSGSALEVEHVSYEQLLSTRDGDRRRWRQSTSQYERFDQAELITAVWGLLTTQQRNLLKDIVNHSISYAARQRGCSRSVVNSELATIQRICHKFGLNFK